MSEEERARRLCFTHFYDLGQVFVVDGKEWYVWDAGDSILAMFGVVDGGSYCSSRTSPDYVLASGSSKSGTPRYVMVGEV
jgi:hypothetical protein